MNAQEILEVIEGLKKIGAKSAKVEGIEVEFYKDEQPLPEPEMLEGSSYEDYYAKPHPLDILSDEEILLWSTSYGEELEVQKKK